MSCNEYKDKLSMFMDDELSKEDATTVELHISKCDSCKRNLLNLQKMSDDLQELGIIEAPDNALEQFHKRLEERKPKSWTNRLEFYNTSIMVSVGVIIILLLMAILF